VTHTTLPDVVAPGLRCVFVGINPGIRSAEAGQHFANPRNDFWRLLADSGLTPRLLDPSEQLSLVDHGLGVTNAARRVTRGSGELRRIDFADAQERLGAPLPFDVAERYYAEIKAIFARELEPVAGVVAALDRIALPSCVASSGPHHKMEVTLRSAGLVEDCFDGWVSAEEVAHGKPAPDVFLAAAERLGVRPAACLVVEDSRNGLLAAKAAGMRCAVVPCAHTRHQDFDECDHRLAALPELLTLL